METRVIGALTDLEATVLENIETPLVGQDPETVVEVICKMVKNLVVGEKIKTGALLGVGIGLAGVVQHREGIVRYSPYFGWKDLPLGELISACLHVPVYIDNDVNTLTVAENLFGVGQGVKDFLTVTIGRGIGLGIMLNNRVYRGAIGGAGEWGHIVIDPEGPECSCGKRGCFEAYVSEPALVEKGREIFNEQIEVLDDLIRLAAKGNLPAKQIFLSAGERIGIQIANLINILSPDLIIVGGEGTRIGDLLFEPMRESINRYVMSPLADTFKLRVEPWGDDAWARGAACLVLDQIFNPPMIQ
jgi:predicted NBD/HSP70 family sugar kinase